ncbi:hypothetical protein [Streptomyces sp. H27-C3]|uniref:hypothetical protein n=1 Tax=Streptomyces sp. H27-C3 TaxID=3046305 RepID=UPI0024B8F103|nr:hypothetical protein [Streptomyces sp. H27-C3]MDJ0465903.1 hypothetical protein [Streptomyces sp. H27-C3]
MAGGWKWRAPVGAHGLEWCAPRSAPGAVRARTADVKARMVRAPPRAVRSGAARGGAPTNPIGAELLYHTAP